MSVDCPSLKGVPGVGSPTALSTLNFEPSLIQGGSPTFPSVLVFCKKRKRTKVKGIGSEMCRDNIWAVDNELLQKVMFNTWPLQFKETNSKATVFFDDAKA